MSLSILMLSIINNMFTILIDPKKLIDLTWMNHEIEEIVKNVNKIETAVEKNFQEHFVNAMAFPHKKDFFQNLEKEVSLPKISSSDKDSNNDIINKKRRRRRRT